MRTGAVALPLLAGLLLAGLLLAGLAAGAARAQTAPMLEIGGKQVPLTTGGWIAAGDAAGRLVPELKLGGFGLIRNLVLLRPAFDGHTIAVMAEVNVNEIGIDDGWGLAGDCEASAVAESAIVVRGGWDAACWFVAARGWDWTADMPPAWRQAQAVAARRMLALPHRTLTVGLRVANRQDVIDLRFHLLETADAPQREVLAEWASASLGLLTAGLTHGLPAGRTLPAFDLAPSALAGAGIVQDRIARLQALVAEGALNEEEARRQETAIRESAAREGSWSFDPDTIEGFRWFALQTGSALSDASLTFLWTAQSLQAATVTLLQTSLRSAQAYFTGVFWKHVTTPVTRVDAARVVDFAYGGTAQAVEQRRADLLPWPDSPAGRRSAAGR